MEKGGIMIDIIKTADSSEHSIRLFRLTNKCGNHVDICNIGASIVSIVVNDKSSSQVDVCLSYSKLENYLGNPFYLGCALGRTAGRIDSGVFELDKQKFILSVNNNGNCLHGGTHGLSHKVFEHDIDLDSRELKLKTKLIDGEQGYPGNLDIVISYSFDDNNRLKIDYQAKCDKPSLCNLSNHLYLNLNGHNKANIENHQLKLYAESYSLIDSNNIPLRDTDTIDSPFDFEYFTAIGKSINDNHEQIKKAKGYDHNFIISRDEGDDLCLAAESYSPETGILVKFYTTEKCFQFYSGNYLSLKENCKDKANYEARQGFCLEAGSWPNGINNKNFDSSILRPGETYRQTTVYEFAIQS